MTGKREKVNLLWNLGLDLTGVDVLGVDELVLVERVMFNGSADHPDGTGTALIEETAAVEDGDLSLTGIFNIVVGSPQPVVLHVETAGASGDVHGHEGADAVVVDAAASGALTDLEIRARETTDTGVDVPKTGGSAAGRVEIVFNKNGTLLLALSGDNHVAPFDGAAITGVADLNDWLGIAHVVEKVSGAQDNRE